MNSSEKAIQAARDAVDRTPEGHSGRPALLNRLGTLLGKRYLTTGVVTDLEEFVRVTREAVDSSLEHSDRVLYMHNLGNALGNRYQRTGAIADLEEAVRLAHEAIELAPENSRHRVALLYNLLNGLGERYSRIGAVADLEEAIRVGREAINIAPGNYPHRISLLCSLGLSLGNSYFRTGDVVDLDEAIQVIRNGVDIAPKNHHEYTRLLDMLGINLGARYKRTGAAADLEEAMLVGRRAVQMTPESHPDRASRLNNFGVRLQLKYSRTGVAADLEEAVQIARQVVACVPQHHPDRASYLNNLGLGLGKRYHYGTQATADLDEAILHYRSSLHQSNASPMVRIVAGRQLLHLTSDWKQAYEISNLAIRLIPKVITRSLENSDKQHALSEVVGLASEAAAAALHAGKGSLVALDLLEQGRGVLATSLDEMRTDILDLQERYPKLAEQFVRLRDELELPAARNASFVGEHRTPSWRPQENRRYDAGNELDHLIVEIRKNDGFEDFLLAPSVKEIRTAARFGPIIIINVSMHSCDALLVEQRRMRALPLPHLNIDDIKKNVREGRLGTPKVLEWLWDAVANPTLNALGFTQRPTDDKLHRVWWISTGPLSKFPLHAAGRHTNGSADTVLDRVMSSYSSSIKTIIHGRRRTVTWSSIPEQALLVAMKQTPGQNELPFAAEEVERLYNLCKLTHIEPIEPGRRKQDLLSHLPDCKLFHFAGHGLTDDTDPSQSSLILEDWKDDPMTVANLLEMNLRKHSPYLAYLSACGTGQIKNERLVDESIHLISACQLAGFRHVIGTLWEVNDRSCVDMAMTTYEGIVERGIDDDSVCWGLHKATRALRDRWLSGLVGTGHQNRFIEKADRAPTEADTRVRQAVNRDEMEHGQPRDVALCDDDDDDDEEQTRPLHWVPYVHFGV